MSIYTEHFETIFGTRQNIQALRNKVLELAIQGKLVEQDKNDELASEFLKRVQAEKLHLITENKIKKEKAFPKIEEDEIPFEIPSSWEWVRFGDIANQIHYGYTASARKNGDAKLLRITDIQNGRVNWDSVPMCEIVTSKVGQYILGEKDIVIARTGGTVGKSFIIQNIPEDSVFASYLIRIVLTDKITSEYVYQYLNSPFYWNQIRNYSQGTGQPNVNAQNLKNLLVPIPPIEEQNRIGAKIRNLMAEIDQLEQCLERKERLELALPKAVVSAISNCQNEEELKVQLGLVIEHFTEVFQTPESLQELRDVILQLGIQGKLVPQNPEDEPASELLKHIQAEKELLIKKKKLKKEKVLPGIEKDEIPFEIPIKWKWAKLGDISLLTMGQSPDGQFVAVQADGIEFHQGKIYFDNVFLKESQQKTTEPKKVVEPRTTLLSVRAPVGILNITPRRISIGRGLCGISALGGMDEFFYFYFLKAFFSYFEEKSTGTTFKAITGEVIKNTPVPLPPLDEQKRIIKKIESLFAIIDKLEKEMQRKQRIVKAMATI